MRVLLLSPPFTSNYMRNARCDYVSITDAQWYPIWLSYCGALLEKEGHDVEIIDAPAENISQEETGDRIMAFRPDLLVVYSSTKSEDSDIKFAEKIKEENGGSTIFVGPFVSIDPPQILEKSKSIDFVVKGEFEYPVLEIVEDGRESEIKNLIYRENNKIIQNEIRPPLTSKELDELPFVTEFYKRHLDLNLYRVPQQLHPFIDFFSGRGCAWGKCTFCLWVHSFTKGGIYNTRSVDNVIEEMQFIKNEIKEVKEIFIQDDMLPKEWARELSNAIIEADIDKPWSCYVKGNLDYETLKLMKKSGCRVLHVGYESASPVVLKNVKKGLTAERMTEFTENAKKADLKIHGDFLIGLPGETAESIKETIEWAKKIDPETAQFSIMNPYPKTPFFDYLTEKGYLKDGEPDYPHLSNEELRAGAKRAVREFYLSWRFAKRMIKEPTEYFFPHLKSIKATFPRMFWERW